MWLARLPRSTGSQPSALWQRRSRLDPKGIPGSDPTSASELEQNYRSVVALEPEIMSQVVRDHGASADMLTLLAKPSR